MRGECEGGFSLPTEVEMFLDILIFLKNNTQVLSHIHDIRIVTKIRNKLIGILTPSTFSSRLAHCL